MTIKNKYFYGATFFFLLMAGLHFLALHYFLYWRLPAFDLLVHFCGGLALGGYWGWLLAERNKRGKTEQFELSKAFYLILLGLLIWEFFEVYFGLTFVIDKIYWFDTFTDILSGLCGALIFLLFIKQDLIQ